MLLMRHWSAFVVSISVDSWLTVQQVQCRDLQSAVLCCALHSLEVSVVCHTGPQALAEVVDWPVQILVPDRTATDQAVNIASVTC